MSTIVLLKLLSTCLIIPTCGLMAVALLMTWLKFQLLVLVFSLRNLAWPGVLAVVGAFG